MLRFEPENTEPTTTQKVFIQSVHVGSLILNPEDKTFTFESIGGNRTVIMQQDETLARLALDREFDK